MKKLIFIVCLFFLPNNSYAMATSGLDFPVGAPNGNGYYDAQDFGSWNSVFNAYHLGEDWNGSCGGDCDLGDSVYSIGDGVVTDSTFMRGWGNVAILTYRFNGFSVSALYGHLQESSLGVGSVVVRGDRIGTIGKGAFNKFAAHLHFEIRDDTSLGFGHGYGAKDLAGYVDPSAFINSHRPVEKTEVEVKDPVEGKTEISWTPTIRPDFEKYEIHRTESPGTCGLSSSSLIETVTDKSISSYVDKSISTGKTYYYCVRTYFSNGLISTSPEKSVIVKLEIIQITTEPTFQMNPTMADGRLYWEDNRTENNTWPRKLYFYDLESKEQGSVSIGIDGAKRPMSPNANGGRVVFVSEDTKGTGRNIYCYDFNTKSAYPISQEKGEQLGPVVSDEGVVVWMDLRNGSNFDLYYLDVTKAEGEVPFVVSAGNQRNPAIWKNRVVWMDSRVGNRHDLYYKEIGGSEKIIATNVGSGLPRIYGDYVTWDYAGKVWLANVVTGEKREIASAVTTSGVSIHGQKIVYGIKEGELFYLHVYDIMTKEDKKIDFPLNYLCFPVIYQNFVAFDHSVLPGTPDKNIYLVFL